MDLDMWQHPATQRNLETLRQDGVRVLPPDAGELASGLSGPGRLPEPEHIADLIAQWFSGEGVASSSRNGVAKSSGEGASSSSPDSSTALPLRGKKALITAGPTYEALDPVRFIGNHSSGKMGIALAEALAELGASVVLVKGPTNLNSRSPQVRELAVTSAGAMFEACSDHFADSDIFVAAAAVADYRPESPSNQKIKKKEAEGDRMTLTLVKTPDILAEMGKRKKPGQLVVGFALETENEVENALAKLERKNLDMIVLNSLNDAGAGFGVDTNRITLIENRNRIDNFPLMSKTEAARTIAERIVELLP
jgi:phosphopantothenoylcysteine decarboxylase/phosphopantothenate--cysteine ligase